MDNNQDAALLRNNPFFVVCIACLIAGLMMFVSIFSYLRSDTRKTLEQIQANNSHIKEDVTALPKNGEVTDEYIDSLEKNITKEIQSHDDEIDFNPSELTDSALGL